MTRTLDVWVFQDPTPNNMTAPPIYVWTGERTPPGVYLMARYGLEVRVLRRWPLPADGYVGPHATLWDLGVPWCEPEL